MLKYGPKPPLSNFVEILICFPNTLTLEGTKPIAIFPASRQLLTFSGSFYWPPQQLLALILHGSTILFLFHSSVISKFDKMLRGLRSEFGAPSSVLCFQEFSHPVPNLMATFYSTEARKMQSSSQVLCIQLTGVGSA